MVKQKGDTMSVLTNVTLVDIIMKQILPSSQHLLTPNEVANAIETHLQTQEENIWPSWTVRQTYHNFMFFCLKHSSFFLKRFSYLYGLDYECFRQ